MITELRILPPLAISRLGSSPNPLENYNLELSTNPLGFRQIAPAETLAVDDTTGEISRAYTPENIVFRDGDQIRPVAPFFEVFARTSPDVLEPLTVDLLKKNKLTPASVKWTVHVGNIKVFRRTGNQADGILAEQSFSDHKPHVLEGRCDNFFANKVLPLGSVRYIKPTAAFPEIRLRFTPAAGLVYGSSTERISLDSSRNAVPANDPVMSADRVIYDPKKGKWMGYTDPGRPTDTNPGSIYAGYSDANGNQVSWGYLDDECDGTVSVELEVAGKKLKAFARVGAGP